MEKTESKWYEKAAGKKQHKTENTKKIQLKNESKIQHKKEEASEEIKKSSKNLKVSKIDSSKNKQTESKKSFNSKVNSKVKIEKLFDTSFIPEDAVQILNNFDEIASSVQLLSNKQKTILPSQIKKLSHQLTDDRQSRRLGYMNEASLISAYVNYFMWWNLVRLTRLFSNFPKNAIQLEDGDFCLDLGSGTLTVVISLWLSRPELRSKKLSFYCLDLSQNALSIGEELFYSIAAKTIRQNEEPWKIIRVKGPFGTKIKNKPKLITSANIFNELAQNLEMPLDYQAKKYTKDIESYFDSKDENQTVLIIEPGDPHSSRLVSLMRDSLIRKNFFPLLPCPHIHSCPMEGRTTSNVSGKWCNFAFNTENCPPKLLKLSEKANLTKERAGLSFVLAKKQSEIISDDNDKKLKLRVASDFIALPELKKSGYYCCSKIGLVLAVDKSNVRPQNGELLEIPFTKKVEDLQIDKKSGALIVEI